MKYCCWLFLALPVMVGSLAQCTAIQCGANASQFVEQFDRFIQESLDTDMSITDTRWKIYDERLESYLVDCYDRFREELTYGDKQTVLMQTIRFYYKRYGSHMIQELQNDENPTSVVLKKEMAAIWEQPDAIFRQIAGEDWEQMIDDFLTDLEAWKNRLQELIEGNE
ncbi:MAG: hypothetical protein R3301_02970 [Saprospiraceae bacterium]|nr:hypothetical protein [Saprospiraceae bacterium]